MSSVLTKILSDDFMWSAMTGNLRGSKRSSKDFININCPMCVQRGESADTRHRCGIKRFPNMIFVNCFNCKFKAMYVVGESLSKTFRNFLLSIGLSDTEVKKLNFKAFEYSKFLNGERLEDMDNVIFTPNFQEKELPPKSKLICDLVEDDEVNEDLIDVLTYLDTRGDVIFNYPNYYWSPEMPRRFIIPYYFRNKIVGYTGRTIDPSDEKNTKYLKSADQENYLYNNQVLYDHKRKYIILVEGPLDAMSIDGVALLGSTINDNQAQWLNNSGKEIILLGDNDSSGKKLIDKAIEYNWHVAFPRLKDGSGTNNWWELNVKDAAEAAHKYGKLYTIQSILQTKTNNKLEIEIKRKLL